MFAAAAAFFLKVPSWFFFLKQRVIYLCCAALWLSFIIIHNHLHARFVCDETAQNLILSSSSFWASQKGKERYLSMLSRYYDYLHISACWHESSLYDRLVILYLVYTTSLALFKLNLFMRNSLSLCLILCCKSLRMGRR